MKLLIACFFTALSLAGCSEAAKPVALSILGYNYTGRYISTFSVNQQGGGICTKEVRVPELFAAFRSNRRQNCLSLWKWNGN